MEPLKLAENEAKEPASQRGQPQCRLCGRGAVFLTIWSILL